MEQTEPKKGESILYQIHFLVIYHMFVAACKVSELLFVDLFTLIILLYVQVLQPRLVKN